jgi:DNA-binding transcriptional LysR family regulator
MSDIDPKKLLYFASIVEAGSLGRAAKVLGISQPALSTSMDRLEASLGVRLLKRMRSGITPTRHGDILYNHARLIREELDLARQNLAKALCEPSARIRLGSLPSLAGTIVPKSLSRWRVRHPDIQFKVTESAQIDLLTGLVRRDFDLVLGLTKVFDHMDGLRQQVLFRDVLRVIARAGHPLTEAATQTWSELAKFPWISPTSNRSHSVLQYIMTSRTSDVPRITVCGSVSLLKSLVSETDHLALLPMHAVNADLDEGRLVVLPFDDPAFNRDIAVFFREGRALDQPSLDLVACVKNVGRALSRGH